MGAADSAATLAGLYGNAMASAYNVPSDFKGGEFVATTYGNGSPRATKMAPKTAGKSEATGTPLPILWASGPSLSPMLRRCGAMAIRASRKRSSSMRRRKSRSGRRYEVPSLMYPRMHQLCAAANDCSPMLTLLEVMLSADDLRALAPGIESRLPSLSSWASRYSRPPADQRRGRWRSIHGLRWVWRGLHHPSSSDRVARDVRRRCQEVTRTQDRGGAP